MKESRPLNEKVSEWLRKQGYPLEMRVATLLRARGFHVSQSHYYTDPATSASREIDIVASAMHPSGLVEVDFVIECKTTSKPWVLFTSEETLNGFSRLFSFGVLSEKARAALINKSERALLSLPWYIKEGRVAYGVTQAFTSGDDMAYKASVNVLKATLSRGDDIKEERKISIPFTFSFPAIVVDGNLFECYLDCNEVTLEEIDEAFFFFSSRLGGNIGTCIHILSANGLEHFCEEAKQLSGTLLELLKEDMEKEWYDRASG